MINESKLRELIRGFEFEGTLESVSEIKTGHINRTYRLTFRQAEGIPMATTFVTNHIRQTGIWTVNAIRKKDPAARSRVWKHLRMIGCFFLGGVILTVSCELLQEKAIWLAMLPLALIFSILVRADLVAERQMFDIKPHGH